MITIADIRKLGPCKDPTEFGAAEDWQGSVFDILNAETITAIDKIWVVVRLIPENTAHEFACLCAERALNREVEKGRTPAKASWEAIKAKRAYIKGEISLEELKEARTAAYAAYAAYAAANVAYAAYAAANAAYAAANAAYAAYAAANAAYAAYAADNAADRQQERDWQVQTLISLLQENT